MARAAAASPAKGANTSAARSRGHGTLLVLALCTACFLAGRMFPAAAPLPAAVSETCTEALRRSTMEDAPPMHNATFEAGAVSTGNTAAAAAAAAAAATEAGSCQLPGEGPASAQPERQPLAAEQQQQARVQEEAAAAAAAAVSSYEEALLSSGALDDRPPVGHGESGRGEYVVQPIQQLSWYPRAYLLPKFVDKERCQHIIDIASKRLYPSGLALKPGEKWEDHTQVRTSSGTFLTRQDDPVVAWVEDKIAAVTMIPVDHGEAFNVLHYEVGQHYESHYDSFPEEEYGKQYSQRIATLLLYLNDPEEGGETTFPLEGKDGLERLATIDYRSCDLGIKVKPRQGDAVLFFSAFVNGTLDRRSLHGACDVIKGEKWAMAKWLRNLGHGL